VLEKTVGRVLLEWSLIAAAADMTSGDAKSHVNMIKLSVMFALQ